MGPLGPLLQSTPRYAMHARYGLGNRDGTARGVAASNCGSIVWTSSAVAFCSLKKREKPVSVSASISTCVVYAALARTTAARTSHRSAKASACASPRGFGAYVTRCTVRCMWHGMLHIESGARGKTLERRSCSIEYKWAPLLSGAHTISWRHCLAAHTAVHNCAVSSTRSNGHSRTIVVPTISPASTFASMRWQVTPVTLQCPAHKPRGCKM